MGLIKITADMTDAERTAVLNSNLQYLQLSNRLRKYPVGMIVAFDTDIDPNELYGGTWERIKGAFIWGIDDGETAGVTGGEKTHTLTEAELPVIDGRIATAVVSAHGTKGVTGHAYGTDFGAATETIGGAKGAAGTQYGYGYKFGSGQAHNNMPPFYGAYIWRKTAHGIGEDPTLTEYEAMMKQMNDALSETKTLCNLLFSNALRGSASGEAVRLTDVSPIEHEIKIKLTAESNHSDFSGVTLKRYGKNLLPYPYKNTNIDYTFNGINYKVKSDGTVVLNGTANEQSYFILAGLVLNKGVYYLSGCPSGGEGSTYSIYFQYDNFSYYKADYGSGVKIDINEKKNCAVAINIGKNTTVSNLIFKPMLEVGGKLTDFEERRTAVAYTPAVDGTVTGVTSISPDMTFLSDTDGIIINAEYNKDLNKAISELYALVGNN